MIDVEPLIVSELERMLPLPDGTRQCFEVGHVGPVHRRRPPETGHFLGGGVEADLGRAGDSRLVTSLALRLKDLLAGKIALRAARFGHCDLAERLDARQELTVGLRFSRRVHIGDKLRKRYD